MTARAPDPGLRGISGGPSFLQARELPADDGPARSGTAADEA